MFTGIVASIGHVCSVEDRGSSYRLSVDIEELSKNLELGSSVSINGVCLTVVDLQGTNASFDVVDATLRVTNLKTIGLGMGLNIERAARFGDEIGGHFLSGHVCDTVEVLNAVGAKQEKILSFRVPRPWDRFLFSKGFIALNGVSLTLADMNCATRVGRVNLIPETCERTNLREAQPGCQLNLEVDSQTQAIVETVERVLSSKNLLKSTESALVSQ